MECIEKAKVSIDMWLALNDSGKYECGWDLAADFFRKNIEKTTWVLAIKDARSPAGAVRCRSLKSAGFTLSLPNAPDGEYVVIQYESQFENRAVAIETITSMHEIDGLWRVAGYYIG